jgi:hypothetical protein
MRLKLVAVVFVILGVMLWAGGVVATPAGTVAVVSGSCRDNGHVLKAGDAVQIGDTVEVPADSHLKLQMVDGSVIAIAPGSSITVERYNVASSGRDVKLSLTQGLLRAQVTSVTGPSTFEASTAAGIASVVSASADWFIRTQADAAQVGVLAGIVDLTSMVTGQSVSIPAHWGTRLEPGLDPVLPRVWAQREFNAVIRLIRIQHGLDAKDFRRDGPG